MELVIKEVDETNYNDVGTCNGEFIVDSQLILHAENNKIHYTVIDRPTAKKRYEQDEVDYSTFKDKLERTVFLAYVGGKVAGQIDLRKNWNKYAYVEGLVVDLNFRRLGIGQALISQAKRWALERQLPGIMLETQNNNVRACKFYEGCGFKISGFDNNLYKGIDAKTDEVALYWYFHLN